MRRSIETHHVCLFFRLQERCDMRESICRDGVHVLRVSDLWFCWRESVVLESVLDELAIGTHVGECRHRVFGFISHDLQAIQCKCTQSLSQTVLITQIDQSDSAV